MAAAVGFGQIYITIFQSILEIITITSYLKLSMPKKNTLKKLLLNQKTNE